MSNASALTSESPPNHADFGPNSDVNTESGEDAGFTDEQRQEHRGMSLTERVRLIWEQALFAVNATEEEVQRILGRLGGWVEMRPEEARRLASELTIRLNHEREQIEQSIDSAVRSALRPFRLPGKKDLAALESRISRLEERIDALLDEQKPAAS